MAKRTQKAKTVKAKARGRRLPALSVFILTNLVFAVVYARFLNGSAVYMYADIGNDSLSSSYPLLVMLSRLFHEGRFAFYDLTFGLGTDITALYLQYLNPIKLLMLIFPTARLPVALLTATVIQVNLISAFGFLYFRTVLHDEAAAVFPTLAWSYSGYVVLWGQNYSFLTCILLFTMTLCLIRFVLAGRKLTVTAWLIPVIALFLVSNYYFLYMTALFCALYVIAWGLAARPHPAVFLKKAVTVAAMAVSGAALGAVALLPIIRTFLDSNRVSRLAETTSSSGVSSALQALKPYDGPVLLTFLGRFLSTNLFGPGSGYRGLINYYEAAAPAVSALCLFAIVYLILKKSSRRLTLFGLAASIAALALPIASGILNMNRLSQRWSFMIALLECLALGFFIKSLLREKNNSSDRALPVTLLVTPVITVLCLGLLFIGRSRGWYLISPKAVVLFGAFFAMYEVLLLIYVMWKKAVLFMTALLLCLCAELVLTNHITVNDRIYMTRETHEHSYYNNGAEQTVPAIKAADPDLYRIAHTRRTDPALYGITATADKMFANEGMVNNYNGLSVYTSTLPASLTDLGGAVLSEQGRNNFFIVDYDNYYLFTLLSGRYVFGEISDQPLKNRDQNLYPSVRADGTAASESVYKNANALPFGYLYTDRLETDSFLAMNALERMQALTGGYVLTDDLISASDTESSDTAESAASPGTASGSSLRSGREYKLADLISMSNDCEVSLDGGNITVVSTGADPFVVFRVPEEAAGRSLILDLSLEIPDGRAQSLQIFQACLAYPNFGPDLCRDLRFTVPETEFVMLLPDSLTDLRIDTLPNETVTFDVASLYAVDPTADFAGLKNSPVSDITFTYEGASPVYHASVDCAGGSDDTMLCVPLPYQPYWKAEIDGEPSQTENINGGLIGIPLKNGTHEVTLTYRVPSFRLTALISVVFAAAFILFYAGVLLQNRRKPASSK